MTDPLERPETYGPDYAITGPDIHSWIKAATGAGFDLIASSGYTSRGDWNGNHPMVHMDFHFRRESDSKDLVICAYCCYGGSTWTTYATAFSGKVARRYHGFSVRGNKEISVNTTDQIPQPSKKK